MAQKYCVAEFFSRAVSLVFAEQSAGVITPISGCREHLLYKVRSIYSLIIKVAALLLLTWTVRELNLRGKIIAAVVLVLPGDSTPNRNAVFCSCLVVGGTRIT